MKKLSIVLFLATLSFFSYGAKFQASDGSNTYSESMATRLENSLRIKELEKSYLLMIKKSKKLRKELNGKKAHLFQRKICFMLGSFNADYKRTIESFINYRSFLLGESLWEGLGVKKRGLFNKHRKAINEIMVFANNDVYISIWNSCLLDEKISIKRKGDLINMLKLYTSEVERGLILLPLFV